MSNDSSHIRESAEARLRDEELAAQLTASAMDEAARRALTGEGEGYLRALSDDDLAQRMEEQESALAAAREMGTNAAPMIRARLERDLEDAQAEARRRTGEVSQ